MKRVLFIAAALFVTGIVAAGSTISPIIQRWRFEHSGAVDVGYPGAMPLVGVLFDDPVAGTYTTEIGGLVMTVNGSPDRRADGTWPLGEGNPGGFGYTHDTTQWMNIADDGTFDFSTPGDVFSVVAIVTPDTVGPGVDYIVAKYKTTDSNWGWSLTRSADDVIFGVSDTGAAGGWEEVVKATSLAVGRMSFITATYTSVPGDGSCVGNIYVDNLATATVSTLEGPPYDGDGDFTIGSLHGNTGSSGFVGTIHAVAVYDRILDESDHDFLFAQWQGRINDKGLTMPVTSASPPHAMMAYPASGVEPFFVGQAANSSMMSNPISGEVCFFQPAAITNLLERSLFRTWAAGAATGWTESTDAGNGSAAIDEDNTNIAVDIAAPSFILTGTTSTALLTSECVDINPASDYNVSVWIIGTSNPANASFRVRINGYSDAGCTADEVLGEKTLTPTATASWQLVDGFVDSAAWDGTSQYANIDLFNDSTGGASTVIASAPMLVVTNNFTPYSFCGSDTDAGTTCTFTYGTIANPIRTNGSKEVQIDLILPYAIADAANQTGQLLYQAPTAGNNNRANWSIIRSSARAKFDYYDSAGNLKSGFVSGLTINAGTEYMWKSIVSEGRVYGEFNGSNFTTTQTAAYQSQQDASLHIPHTGASYDICTSNLLFRRVPSE